MTTELLSCMEVTKRYGGLTAVEDVNVAIQSGDLIGLIGPNGAGKSTLIGLISGFIPPTAGKIHFKGLDISGWSPCKVAAFGMRRTFQGATSFSSLSLEQNILMGVGRGSWTSDLRRKATELLEKSQLDPALPSQSLSAGQLRLLSVARAVIAIPELLLLDEPVAGLGDTEVDLMSNMIQHVRDCGTTVMVIEHNIDFVFRFCPRIVVLEEGRIIAEGSPTEIKHDQKVIEAYLGRRSEDTA